MTVETAAPTSYAARRARRKEAGDDDARAACRDAARLAELAQLASWCEQVFGGPQDLEWAVANGCLHLLQSRPVTTGARS